MKKPDAPTPFFTLIQNPKNLAKLPKLVTLKGSKELSGDYPHWDQLRKNTPPEGFTSEEWWLAVKMQRLGALKPIPLRDTNAASFQFSLPECVLEKLHEIDIGSGATINITEPITNP